MRKEIEIKAVITEFDSVDDLPETDATLIAAAGIAADTAYAPYSQFNVGAAILLENGNIIQGNNQENVAYPSGLCAERVALFSAGSNHPNIPVKAIAITAKSDRFNIDEPLAPCGACRQVMVEYETKYNRHIRIILRGQKGKILVINSVSDILPLSFNSNRLKGN